VLYRATQKIFDPDLFFMRLLAPDNVMPDNDRLNRHASLLATA